jgi:hypothetical protein
MLNKQFIQVEGFLNMGKLRAKENLLTLPLERAEYPISGTGESGIFNYRAIRLAML